MEPDSALKDHLPESSFRGLKLATAGFLLVSVALLLFLVFAAGESRITSEITTGIVWLCAGASVVLPVLIITHTAWDVLRWFRTENEAKEQPHGNPVIHYVFRAAELGLAAVILTVIGLYGHLVTTQPGGEGAGGIGVGVVLIVAITSILLSIIVLAQGVVHQIRFSSG